jgi:heme oxygenase
LANAANPFKVDSKYDALGLMYVLEGSTLGGRVILKALARNPAFNDIKAIRFYEGHGEETGLFWKKYQEVLMKVATDDATEDKIVNAANRTFEEVARIFSNSLVAI